MTGGGKLMGGGHSTATVLPALTVNSRGGACGNGFNSANVSLAGIDANADAPYHAIHCGKMNT